MNVNQQLP
jgi:isopenicillin N synthase-like dioxygenase